MKDPKYHIYLTNEERSEVLKSLIDLKNEMIVQGKYTDCRPTSGIPAIMLSIEP